MLPVSFLSDDDVEVQTSEEASYVADAMRVFESTCSTRGKEGVLMVLAVYWDGLSDGSKASFADFKKWSAEHKTGVVVQALNAKKGAHTLMDNVDALVNSLIKKLPLPKSEGATPSSATALSAAAPLTNNTVSLNGSGSAPEVSEPIDEERLTQKLRVGQGECFWVVAAPASAFDAQVEELRRVAASLFTVTPEPRETPAASAAPLEGPVRAQEFMLRRHRELEHIEMRIAMCGNVDSGKSTTTSVLTRGVRDDGRGLARTFVFNHKHELDTGRTSSISENHIGFDHEGRVVNYDALPISDITPHTLFGGSTSDGMNPQQKHVDPHTDSTAEASSLPLSAETKKSTSHHHHSFLSVHDLAMQSSKVVTLYDLAGHEKYLKTTVVGMTRSVPDYACVVISANNGIQRMTKEHLGLCLALKIPFFIVLTRVDATPENVRTETMQTIVKLLKAPTVKKLPFAVKRPDDVIVAAKNLHHDRIAPLFEISNVTGQGVADLLKFINLLPVRKDWATLATLPKEVIIDTTFFVTGVGTVVGGIVAQGQFRTNDTVWLGPDGLGAFRPTQIKSIHVKGVEVDHVDAGNDAAFCLKKERRNNVRKGNVLLDMQPDPKVPPKSFWQFEAEIVILYHSTTIAKNYEPVVHTATARQSARILDIDKEVLRTGDHALVKFHFLYRPEFLKIGQRLIFREGRTKGIGTVTSVSDMLNETFVSTTRRFQKESTRSVHQPPATGGGAAAKPHH